MFSRFAETKAMRIVVVGLRLIVELPRA